MWPRRRREFTLSDRIAIRGRASDGNGRVHCERCGRWCPKKADYQIDHVLAEGMRPLADPQAQAHPGGRAAPLRRRLPPTKDERGYAGDIAEAAVRREAAHLGSSAPRRRKINWGREKADKPPLEVAHGSLAMARRYLPRLALVLAVLALAKPSAAHCYRTWNYPWPQHCKVTHVAFRDVPCS